MTPCDQQAAGEDAAAQPQVRAALLGGVGRRLPLLLYLVIILAVLLLERRQGKTRKKTSHVTTTTEREGCIKTRLGFYEWGAYFKYSTPISKIEASSPFGEKVNVRACLSVRKIRKLRGRQLETTNSNQNFYARYGNQVLYLGKFANLKM